ncbi:hypothetical protein P4E94_06990 [Pontiellaceae bacterium B12219]|nr:hypothetical protein [Pontiellaceae bacterium B12219]
MDKEQIIELVKSEFPGIFVDIISHDTFGKEFQVRCFGVERSLFRSVRRKIISINQDLFPESDVSLISIVFTPESTKENFPAIAAELEQTLDCCGNRNFDWFFGGDIYESVKPQFFSAFLDDAEEDEIDAVNHDSLINMDAIGNWPTDINPVSADESYSMAA